MNLVRSVCCFVVGAGLCSVASARPGACCFSGGGCFVTTQAICEAHHGTYAGDDVTCADAHCPRPAIGACCLTGGACFVTTQALCEANHGTYAGDNVTCADANCPRPATGACCLNGGSFCAVLTQPICEALHGTYAGDNVACADAACAPTCGCDWNHDGTVNSSDVFAFIHDFFAGNADFNGDGVTNTRDFFDFILCVLQCA